MNGELDRESRSRYCFRVIAEDNGDPVLAASQEICVEIEDENDNQPSFKDHFKTIRVMENATIGTVIIHFQCDDKDTVRDRHLTFKELNLREKMRLWYSRLNQETRKLLFTWIRYQAC